MAIRRIQRGRNHGYTIHGAKAMGVTTALSKGMPKPALMYWAARCVAEEAAGLMWAGNAEEIKRVNNVHTELDLVDYLKKAPVRKRDNAAVRGTKVHKLAEHLVYGREVVVPPELLGHVTQCAKFLDEWHVRPLLVEKVIGSYRWGYAGTFDLIGEIPDGRRILFDYKTGRDIWPETALQLAAYRHADAYVADDGLEMPMREVGIHESKAVHIGPDSYSVIPLDTGPAVHKAFLHVLQVAKAADVMEAWKGPPEVCP
jgi:hypothetical protein